MHYAGLDVENESHPVQYTDKTQNVALSYAHFVEGDTVKPLIKGTPNKGHLSVMLILSCII